MTVELKNKNKSIVCTVLKCDRSRCPQGGRGVVVPKVMDWGEGWEKYQFCGRILWMAPYSCFHLGSHGETH